MHPRQYQQYPVPPQWYWNYQPPYSQGPGQHRRPKKGTKGDQPKDKPKTKEDVKEGTRFCVHCGTSHQDTKCTKCRTCKKPLPLTSTTTTVEGEGHKPSTPAADAAPPPGNLSKALLNKEAVAAAGGVSLADVQFFKSCEAALEKGTGIADFPELSSMTVEEQASAHSMQTALDCLNTDPQTHAALIQKTQTALDQLRAKHYQKCGSVEGVVFRLSRMQNNLRTTWSKTKTTLAAEVTSAKEALALAQARADEAERKEAVAVALYHQRQESVQRVIDAVAPPPPAPEAQPSLSPQLLAPLLSSIITEVEKDGKATTVEGVALPTLAAIRWISSVATQRAADPEFMSKLCPPPPANSSTDTNTTTAAAPNPPPQQPPPAAPSEPAVATPPRAGPTTETLWSAEADFGGTGKTPMAVDMEVPPDFPDSWMGATEA